MNRMIKQVSALIPAAALVLMLLLIIGLSPQEAQADDSAQPANVSFEAQTAGDSGYVTGIIASWDAVEGATGYRLTLRKKQDGRWSDYSNSFTPENQVTTNGRVSCEVMKETEVYGPIWEGEMAISVRTIKAGGQLSAAGISNEVILGSIHLYFTPNSSRTYTVLAGSTIGGCIEGIIDEDAGGNQYFFKRENGATYARKKVGIEWSPIICVSKTEEVYYGSLDEMTADAYYIPATGALPATVSNQTMNYNSISAHLFLAEDLCTNTNTLHRWEAYFEGDDRKSTFEKDGKIHFRCADCGKKYSREHWVDNVDRIELEATEFPYTGKAITPEVTVIDGGDNHLKKDVDFTIEYDNNVTIGTASVIVRLQGLYEGTEKLFFEIEKGDLANAAISGITNKIYTGREIRQDAVLELSGAQLEEGADYTTHYLNNVKAGTATVIYEGRGNLTGTQIRKFQIDKAANSLKVTGKTAKVKYRAVKKKNQTLAVTKVIDVSEKGQGTITYTKVSGNKKITINKTTGYMTIKKGIKKGKYPIVVQVRAGGNINYRASAEQKVTININVK